MGVSWPLFKIVWKFSGSNPCLALMKVFLEGALPIKCSARLLLMMTHQWGQYEKSVCCGTIDSLNQDLYRCATQHVAAWWHGEGSPWVSALKRWKHFCHELMSWADYVIWIKLSSLFREGAWRRWNTEIALSYFSVWSIRYCYILQQKENYQGKSCFGRGLIIVLSWLKRSVPWSWKTGEKESKCSQNRHDWAWNRFVGSGQNEAGLTQWKVFMDDNTRVHFKNQS